MPSKAHHNLRTFVFLFILQFTRSRSRRGDPRRAFILGVGNLHTFPNRCDFPTPPPRRYAQQPAHLALYAWV